MNTLPLSIDVSTRRRIEINTYHGFAWNVLRSHGYLLCRQPGISLLLPAQARARLAGLTGAARTARQRALFDEEGLVSFDLFPTLLCELFACAPQLAQAYARSYPLIIVDEFQDTNADEWAMIRTLGPSSVIALGDPKQRIYDFKGADPRRFDEFIAEFRPAVFDFAGENRRSAGTGITGFADAMIAGNFRPKPYAGVTIGTYAGQGMRPLKQSVLQAAARLRLTREWSVVVLVPANVLAVGVFDYMR
ncbi:MAG: UvrD-helicase domain-containing protein [Rhodanobacteraceae bacterium]|nr:UvrD-helicase domain-containing protein [Rhodanobacteraceae bacterium]